MNVLEYAQDMGKSVEEIISKCKKIGINVNTEEDMLSDDDIVELDIAFSNESEEEVSGEVDEEIIKKLEEDDYYDEVIDTNLRKIGSILGDCVDIGCNSVCFPGTIIYPRTNVYPLTRVRRVIGSDKIVKDINNIVDKEK